MLPETDCHYATIDKKLSAIYFVVKRNEVYLLNKTCVGYTDHKPPFIKELQRSLKQKIQMDFIFINFGGFLEIFQRP